MLQHRVLVLHKEGVHRLCQHRGRGGLVPWYIMALYPRASHDEDAVVIEISARGATDKVEDKAAGGDRAIAESNQLLIPGIELFEGPGKGKKFMDMLGDVTEESSDVLIEFVILDNIIPTNTDNAHSAKYHFQGADENIKESPCRVPGLT